MRVCCHCNGTGYLISCMYCYSVLHRCRTRESRRSSIGSMYGRNTTGRERKYTLLSIQVPFGWTWPNPQTVTLRGYAFRYTRLPLAGQSTNSGYALRLH